MPSSHLILYCPLLLLPPIPPSIRVFSNESTLRMRWPKYWIFSFSIIPFKEHPELISFRMDWLDLLAVQGTLKSLLQHHSSNIYIYLICFELICVGCMKLPSWLSGKESACNARATGDVGSIPGSGRSPGGGNVNPLQYSCLENPIDRGVWRAAVHRVAKNWTQLN